MVRHAERIGHKFGSLTIRDIYKSGRYYVANVLCDCGKIKEVQISHILYGKTVSCGCKNAAENKIGKKYGKLTIIDVYKNSKYSMAIVRCECGVEKSVQISALLCGNTISCGCKRKSDFIERNKNDDTNKILKNGRSITLRKYTYFHVRLLKKYGKPTKCEFCNKCNAKRYEYALKKGKYYSDNKDDYLELCPSCHRKYDYNPETGIKIGDRHRGVPKPIVSQKLSGRIRKEYWVSIIQKGENGNRISEYKSIKSASKETGIIRTGIMNALSGCAKTAGGFIWEYA